MKSLDTKLGTILYSPEGSAPGHVDQGHSTTVGAYTVTGMGSSWVGVGVTGQTVPESVAAP